MSDHAQTLDLVDTILSEAIDRRLLHCDAEDAHIDGHRVRIDGKDMLHFGSCSYLGLELDPRLKQAAIEATIRLGTQFSSSRAYLSAPPYAVLEDLLERLFGAPVIVTPSTTMAHLSALPVLVQSGDLMVLDHQVHHSVQMACQSLFLQGVKIELLRHGRLDQLEEILCQQSENHARIWYAVDGIYSMFGDQAPMAELHALLERHEHFHLYVDDAHGMSWKGPHGRGHALAEHAIHPRMVMTSSLNKSFAAAGGVLVLPDAETKRRVRVCAGPLIFSGPIQPPMLGAAVTSARIHLSGEIEEKQRRLAAHIADCNALMYERGLPLMSDADSPIRFLGVGPRGVTMNLGRRLADEGFFLNAASFPAVPMKRSGLRFTLTLHQSREDLLALTDSIERNYDAAFREEGQDPERIWERLRLPTPDEGRRRVGRAPRRTSRATPWVAAADVRDGGRGEPRLEHRHSIEEIPRSQWDACLGSAGASGWASLRFLERCFAHRSQPEDRWRFSYYRILDPSGRCLLATFFSQALWKDDMLAPAATSEEIEARRARDPYLLTTQVLGMGTLLTEGRHLYLAPELSAEERDGLMRQLIQAVELEASRTGAKTIVLRDFVDDDPARDEAMLEAGFVKQTAPDSFVLDPRWTDEEDFLRGLTRRSRWHQRRAVLPWNDHYRLELLGAAGRPPSEAEHARMRELYQNVKRQSLELNTFDLPDDFFEYVADDESWEILALRLRDAPPDAEIVGILACLRGPDQYLPTVIGLDYRYVREQGLYRQCLRHAIERGRSLGVSSIHLGMGAPLEKTRFGARTVHQCCYGQAEDHYGAEAVAQLTTQIA